MKFLLIPLLLAAPVLADTTADQAAAAWAQRDQEGQTEKAAQLWKQALKENPEKTELWIHLTRALGRQVRRSENSSQRKKLAQEARDAGAQAVAKNPQRADAWAYHAESIGQWANQHKGPGSLKRVKQAVAALQKALELDPHYAYAHMLLAEFYRQAPSVISVGDKKKALEQARMAVRDGPAQAINHLVFARALLDNGRREEAILELRSILALPAPPDAGPETHSDQATARALLRELGAVEAEPGAKTGTAVCSQESSGGNACGH